ncbi:hypothetical protein [Halospeciosus flavus]|uniref:DUF8135 domain-containing protein n=1 Tax=Halospeciosus flavus TaxID=3032283 RepID=A0ABD5Z1D6_9EURY|nr:hypothetical protein [Halospeciosus flavus]
MSDESEDTDDERDRDRGETGLDAERDADVEIDADADSNADTAGDEAGEDTPFEQQEYEEVDVDEVLRGPVDGDADSETEPESAPETDESEEAAVNVIESRICHNCPYFGEPPELHCTHEGTQIREVVDTDHYVVVDCPVVVEELEF